MTDRAELSREDVEHVARLARLDLSEVQAKPNTTVNPCGDFEGKKAEVQYVDSSDKTVNGQVVAILLRN